MSLQDFVAELDKLAADGKAAFQSAADAAAVEAARVELLGAKSGRLKSAQKGLGAVPPADKPAAGKRFNEVKTELEAALAAAQRGSPAAGPRPRAQNLLIPRCLGGRW